MSWWSMPPVWKGCSPLARFDKYDPISGGFRAPLAADFNAGTPVNGVYPNFGKVYAVGLNASGQVTVGAIAADPGCVGVMILTSAKYAGDVVDIMTHGEIVDINTTATPFDNFAVAGTPTAAAAGKKYYGVAASGIIDTANTGNYAIGWTVEARRLIVRLGNRALAA